LGNGNGIAADQGEISKVGWARSDLEF